MRAGLFVAAVAIAAAALCVNSGNAACSITNDFGCFVDSGTSRVLPSQVNDAGSLEECAENCRQNNFFGTAGTENGHECWCSNKIGSSGQKADDSDCNIPCSNNPSENCGADARIHEFDFKCDQSSTYSCDGNTCVQDPNGPYTDPSCDGACSSPPPPPSPAPSPPPSPSPAPSPPPPPQPGPPPPPGPKPAPGKKNPKKKGLSGGSTILIIFFCGLVIPYFIFGALFMKYRRGASGADIIPNREFWASLPGLIKDGFSFTFSKVSGRSSSYQKL